MDTKTKEYIEKAAEACKGKPWSFADVKIEKGQEKIEVVCLIHGPFVSYKDSVAKGSGCKKCAYLVKNEELYNETLEVCNIDLGEVYDKNIEIAKKHDIKIEAPKPIQSDSKPLTVEKGKEKNFDLEEYSKNSKYKDMEIEELVHMYKCSLTRASNYKSRELKEKYKALSQILKKQIEKR